MIIINMYQSPGPLTVYQVTDAALFAACNNLINSLHMEYSDTAAVLGE